MVPDFDKCVFCRSRYTTFGNTPDFMRLVRGRATRRILYETSNFVVLPSLGQIVEGYLLIMPKAHYRSFAFLSGGLLDEAEHVYSETRRMLKRVYRTPIFYEHGMGYTGSGNGCCVDHAHIHAIPAPVMLADILRQEFRWTQIRCLTDLAKLVRGAPYLFVEDATHERCVYHATGLRAQFVRHLVAELLGTPDRGDWMLYPGIEELLRTIEKLSFWDQGKSEDRVEQEAIPAYLSTPRTV